MNRDFYKILVVGASGKGKTYMFRNMDVNTTGFINVENKPLPFKNTFKYHKRVSSAKEALDTLIEYGKNPEIKSIVFDSFSAYMDLVLADARATKRGFDVWTQYNEEISKFHSILNLVPKEVFVTGHYEILDVEGTPEKRFKVHGKENEGRVERHYTVVMYADNKYDENNKSQYYLQLSGEGISAKCPPDIFGEDVITIPNDGKYILEKVLEFVK